MKWICRALARMEAQDLDFEARLRALERLSGGEGGRGAALDGERSRAGGVVAVIVRVLRRGGEGGEMLRNDDFTICAHFGSGNVTGM